MIKLLYCRYKSMSGAFQKYLLLSYALYALFILGLLMLSNQASAQVDLTKKSPLQHGKQALKKDSTNTMIHFKNVSELQNWVIVNDTVMGGRSQTRVESIDLGEPSQPHLLMYGELSLKNNGGFASIRRIYSPLQWQERKPLSITVMGDGREYQFRLRTNKTWDGVAYVANFKTTQGQTQTFSFLETDFTPRFRGRLVSDAGNLNFADITQIGIMLSDGNEGEFALMIKEIVQQS